MGNRTLKNKLLMMATAYAAAIKIIRRGSIPDPLSTEEGETQ